MVIQLSPRGGGTVLLSVCSLLFASSVSAQIVIQNDDFSLDPAANGWTENVVTTNTAVGDIVATGTAAEIDKTAGTGRVEGTITQTFSTVGYDNIDLELLAYQSSTNFEGGAVTDFNADSLSVLIDTGGGLVSLFERTGVWAAPGGTGFSDGGAGPGTTASTSSGVFLLPAAAANNAALIVQIRGAVWAGAESYFLDDFTLRGTLIIVAPAPTPAAPTSAPQNAAVLVIRPVAAAPAAAQAGKRGASARPQELLVEDVGAIQSLLTSGVPMVALTGDVNLLAAQSATRDINERLFRMRARMMSGPADSSVSSKPGSRTGSSSVAAASFQNFSSSNDRNTAAPVINDNVVAASFSPMAGMVPVDLGKNIAMPLTYEDGLEIEIFSGGDYAGVDRDRLADYAGFQSQTYSGTLGVEVRPTSWSVLGLAYTYLENDTEFGSGLGSIDIEGHHVSAYGALVGERVYADLLYGHGWFDNEIRRSTGLGSTAVGEPGADSDTLEFHSGYHFLHGSWVTGPTIAMEAVSGSVDGYAERLGGNADLVVGERDYDSLISSLGWQVSRHRSWFFGEMIPQLRLAWDHENESGSDGVDVGLVQSPYLLIRGDEVRSQGSYERRVNGQRPGRDYLNAGAAIRFQIGSSAHLMLDYEGHFLRRSESAHFGSLRLGFLF